MNLRRILWIAFLFSTLVYGVLAYASQRNFTLQPLQASLRRPMVIVVYGVALLLYVTAIVVSNSIDRSALLARGADGKGTAITAVVVRFAILELVAICGLLASFVIHDWRVYLPAWAMAIVGFARPYPSSRLAPGR